MRRRGRHTRRGPARSVWKSVLRLGAAVFLSALAFGYGGSSYAAPARACCTPAQGILKVAPAGVTPLVWYDSANPPPALTNQISAIASNMYPGRSGTMVAYVKNTGTTCGVPGIMVTDLMDTGLLSGSLDATITYTYTSSLKPGTTYVVAKGTVASLAAHGSYVAPVKLGIYSTRCGEIGTWAIRVAMPASAGNELQCQRCVCSIRFLLAGCCR